MPTLDFAATLSSSTLTGSALTDTALGGPTFGSSALSTPAVGARRSGLSVVELHDDMWRITVATGDVVGYVERFPSPQGVRFRAKRLLPRQGRFMVDGEFWSMDDAIACFR